MAPTYEEMQEWYRTREKILNDIRTILNSGVRIFYEWDAGGDSTPCWPVTEPEIDFPEELHDLLYDEIVSELKLPNAGEHFKKGKGELFFREEDVLVIRYSLDESQDYESDDLPDWRRAEEIEMDDPAGLRKYLNRGTVFFEMEIDWKRNEKFEIRFRMNEGDLPAYNHEHDLYYASVIRNAAASTLACFGPRKEGYLGGRITVYCQLLPGTKAKISFMDRFQLVKEIQNEEAILFEKTTS